jgi:hypothetical protein
MLHPRTIAETDSIHNRLIFRALGEERLILSLGPGIVILLQVCNRKMVENSDSLRWRRLMAGGRYQFAAASFAFWRFERVSESAQSADSIPGRDIDLPEAVSILLP